MDRSTSNLDRLYPTQRVGYFIVLETVRINTHLLGGVHVGR